MRRQTSVATTSSGAPSGLIPANEGERLAALRRYEILDTPPDGSFDRITALAARIFDVPISIVTLVDEDRIWFKSRQGVDVDEIPRDPGLCASAILYDEPWIVTDAKVDPRTLANPLVVGELGLRFYAGVPLATTEGHKLGTLNVIDRAPRELSDDEIAVLADLAAIVVDEMELRLAALREERRLEQLKSDFVSTVSHQLRTPLAGVYGAALTLQREEAVPSEELRGRLLELIGEQAGRLTAIVEKIVAASELEAGRFRILAEPFDPLSVVEASVDAVRARLPSGLTVEVSADDPVPTLSGDADKLRVVLDELIDNAIRYSPAGGRIEVAVERRERSLRFRVADEGIGIPPREAARVFRKFERLDPDMTLGVDGLGLGLYVCREFVARMGGRIWLEPGAPVGSSFVFDLPRR